jgi:hypothetical protein
VQVRLLFLGGAPVLKRGDLTGKSGGRFGKRGGQNSKRGGQKDVHSITGGENVSPMYFARQAARKKCYNTPISLNGEIGAELKYG